MSLYGKCGQREVRQVQYMVIEGSMNEAREEEEEWM